MKKLIAFITFILTLTGCSVKPIVYDLSTSKTFPPLKTTKNIPNLKISNFKYIPHINISQHTISRFGGFNCQSDGGTPGFIFAKPIKDIIQTEVKTALNEVMLPSENPTCSLSATISLASWNAADGDTIIDMIFEVKKSKKVKFIKRVQGNYNSPMFNMGSDLHRLLANSSRISVETLINDKSFLEEVNKSCK